MSTNIPTVLVRSHAQLSHTLCRFVSDPVPGPDLLASEAMAERLTVLDQLDSRLGHATAVAGSSDSGMIAHLRLLRSMLDAENQRHFDHARSEIIRDGHSPRFRQWLEGAGTGGETAPVRSGLSFDHRDEIVSGVLQLREPGEPNRVLSPDMRDYQPTPARHILDLIAAVKPSKNDVLIDLGSGLGHVPLVVSILTGNRSVGIELQPAYVVCAQECARSLSIRQAQFVAQDAQLADLSDGTVFYLYTPFTGSILNDVLQRLRNESAKRQIRICSLGPCTRMLQTQPWLYASVRPDTGRIAVFQSQ